MYLQAAIDTASLEEAESALRLIGRLSEVTCIEIGNPLVTQYGVTSVEIFKNYAPLDRLYADIKIIDFPELLIRPYLRLGIRRFSAMAFMNDRSFEELANVRDRLGLTIFVSTMGYPLSKLRQRIEDLSRMGFDQIVCHGSGSPAQALDDLLERADELAAIAAIKLIAAGGISATTAHRLRAHKFWGLIVGRGLVGPNPQQNMRRIISDASLG